MRRFAALLDPRGVDEAAGVSFHASIVDAGGRVFDEKCDRNIRIFLFP
jgi:hypothetical protein